MPQQQYPCPGMKTMSLETKECLKGWTNSSESCVVLNNLKIIITYLRYETSPVLQMFPCRFSGEYHNRLCLRYSQTASQQGMLPRKRCRLDTKEVKTVVIIYKGKNMTFLLSGGRRGVFRSSKKIWKRRIPSFIVSSCPSLTRAIKSSDLSITSRWLSPSLGSQPTLLKCEVHESFKIVAPGKQKKNCNE